MTTSPDADRQTVDAARRPDPLEPGRSCPLAYRYRPEVFARPAEIAAEVLYVVGGLYGNEPALDAIEALAAREARPAALVFNGDFHWFDVDPQHFAAIDDRVARHRPLRGNVETEIANDDDAAGCGCAYPESVGADEVDRSNRIIARLRETARRFPQRRARLVHLPMHAVAAVGDARVAIVHGDLQSLAGWGLSAHSLRDAAHCRSVAEAARAASIDVIAGSHTCLPVLRRLHPDIGAPVLVINNGTAGMPNFRGARGGLITRIATTPPPVTARYGELWQTGPGGTPVFVDALDVHWPQSTWLQMFLDDWPAGSAAHRSYWRRLVEGPDWTAADADRLSD